jgi:hypothetical protein
MLIGLGLAESTPGPLNMVTQYVGFLGAWQLSGNFAPLTDARSLAGASWCRCGNRLANSGYITIYTAVGPQSGAHHRLDRIAGLFNGIQYLLDVLPAAGFQFQIDARFINRHFVDTAIVVDMQHIGFQHGQAVQKA